MLIAPKTTQWVRSDWPAPSRVCAVVSTRAGHFSAPPYDGYNTAEHVGDSASSVALCRRFFLQHFSVTSSPQWLHQVHGTQVIEAPCKQEVPTADAVFSGVPGQVCTLHTADCLPVFFCNQSGSQVGLAHAGWRGLAAGVLENTLKALSESPEQLMCWLGPAISQPYFEVGPEVKQAFMDSQPVPGDAFVLSGRTSAQGEHYLCDLFALARERLAAHGVRQVYGGNYCTFSDPRFFSYRRQATTGRILSAIWINPGF